MIIALPFSPNKGKATTGKSMADPPALAATDNTARVHAASGVRSGARVSRALRVRCSSSRATAVRLLRISFAQAYAFPSGKKLLFTERLLELLSDEELASVCAHELGHLKESKLDQIKRHVHVLAFWPLIFMSPLCHRFGPLAFLALLVNAALVPRIYQKISQRLERRADALAKGNETDSGHYARALEKLYEDSLLPAVTASQKTHPHLYDRMLAAGVTPEYDAGCC